MPTTNGNVSTGTDNTLLSWNVDSVKGKERREMVKYNTPIFLKLTGRALEVGEDVKG